MLDNVVPHPFDSDVIFIAVDLEAYERNTNLITEIGVAVLDTRDLKCLAPGPAGSEWQKAIRARHLRVAEYVHLKNKDFVEGCPENFEFGKTEFVGKDKLPQTIASCFKFPYCDSTNKATANSNGEEKRNIVLVGHDIGQDIKFLQQCGYSVANCGNMIDTIDTVALFRTYTKDPNARSLGNLLYHFDLEGWHLHNAGNDAVYTLWAMLAICVQEASERGTDKAQERFDEALEKRTEVAVQQAKERVLDETEGWEDGGVPVNKPMFGPPRPGEPQLFTMGGAILDV
jgi:hypothetical protein